MHFRHALPLSLLTLSIAACGGSSGTGESVLSFPGTGNNPVTNDPNADTTTDAAETGTDITTDTVTDTTTDTTNTLTETTTDTDTGTDSTDTDTTTGSTADDDDCSIAAQKRTVDFNMRDYYLFYDQVPVLDLDAYDSPEDLIVDLRVDPDRFTHIRDADTQAQQFDEGVAFAFGFSSDTDADGQRRISQVLVGSPMDLAGAQRGDILVAANDVPWEELTNESFLEIFGPRDDGTTVVNLTLRDGDAADRVISVSRAEFPLLAVQTSTILEHSDTGVRVGYVFFESFIEPAAAELDQVLQSFVDRGIDELVLDLRYNGGGRTSIAYKLASQIAGEAFVGQTLDQLQFNDKYADDNIVVPFLQQQVNLNLPRVIILASEFTASSSEIVINGLKPHIEVTVIGERTVGKPFQSSRRNFCGKSMNAIEIISVNAAGESVIDGVEADCHAADEFRTAFGDPGESLLSGALAFVHDGTCATAPVQTASRASKQDQLPQVDAFMRAPLGLSDYAAPSFKP